MKNGSGRVYQFKVTLQDVDPPVWRRIQVPENYTFWDLHVAIQDSMGWLDHHLHEYLLPGQSIDEPIRIGIPDDEGPDPHHEILSGWEIPISEHFALENPAAKYEYDFGDSWEHSLELEEILIRQKGVEYPICLDGARACPPEDVGGVPGYQEFLRGIADAEDQEHENMLAWVGGEFDPERFDPNAITFDDPKERWESAFAGD